MPDSSSNLPLADVLRAANDLVSAKLIEDWALGGALAAVYYVEPFSTYDADIFFIPVDEGFNHRYPSDLRTSSGPRLAGRARTSSGARNLPVQFLAAQRF